MARMPTRRGGLGNGHIAQKYALPINALYRAVFNPWLKLHRPCLFASTTVRAQGMAIKRCRHDDARTAPFGTGLVRLKPGVTTAALQARADAQACLAAEPAMQCAKTARFERFKQCLPQSMQHA